MRDIYKTIEKLEKELYILFGDGKKMQNTDGTHCVTLLKDIKGIIEWYDDIADGMTQEEYNK